jgi:hypothetical protein
MSFVLQLLSQLTIVVDFSVEEEPETLIVQDQRLLGPIGKV